MSYKTHLEDGRIILSKMDRYNTMTKQVETVITYQLLPVQKTFVYRVYNSLQPIKLSAMEFLDPNERLVMDKVKEIIDNDAYTDSDIPILEIAKQWYVEYSKNPRMIVMTSHGHELRKLKVGKWYTNPKYADQMLRHYQIGKIKDEILKYFRIKSVIVNKDAVHASASNKILVETFWNQVTFDAVITDKKLHEMKLVQSNTAYDDLMREVPDETINKLYETNI